MTDDDLNLPPKLAESLRNTYAHRPTLPADLDRAILARAEARFAQRRRLRLLVRWGSGAAAAVAACIVVAILLIPHPPRLDASRPVNMVDALMLAKQLKAGGAVDRSWDFNHDGKIDHADVEAIALSAVSLKQQVAAQTGFGVQSSRLSVTPALVALDERLLSMPSTRRDTQTTACLNLHPDFDHPGHLAAKESRQ